MAPYLLDMYYQYGINMVIPYEIHMPEPISHADGLL